VRGSLPGADASVPNSVLRVLSDSQGALAHLNLQYLDWLALQLLPDTAETEWLDRHGHIWLVNSDSSTGRKVATFAVGTASFTGITGTVVPTATLLGGAVEYETTAEIVIGSGPTEGPIRALDAGSIGNMENGNPLACVASGVESVAVVELAGGVDTETDEQLRARVLQRIQQPPMGGAQEDYVTWALAVPGVTRAWAAPEQGIGTITVRFLMDDLRKDETPPGWPTPPDIQTVHNYIDKVRPVTVSDCYVFAPIPQFIDIEIANLVPGTVEVAGAIQQSIEEMLVATAAPGVTIYAAWVSYAIMNAVGVQSFNLITTSDYVMPSLGHMAVLGTILYDDPPTP
jgi:uncharacterized phage protein gp47/JayE